MYCIEESSLPLVTLLGFFHISHVLSQGVMVEESFGEGRAAYEVMLVPTEPDYTGYVASPPFEILH